MSADPSELFCAAIQMRLGVDPGPVAMDGSIHRFPTKADGRDLDGWYIGFDDSLAAGAFGCWRSDVSETWCARDVRMLSTLEREAHRRRMSDLARERDAERKRRHEEAALRATEIWEIARPADALHPYLERKGVASYGLRERDGRLIVPVRIDRRISSLQFIDGDGGKRFLPGGEISGGYFAIGKPDDVIIVCEGYATGATLHQVTGYAVAVAFNAGNLAAVARAIRNKLPDATLVIAADDDVGTEGNPGLAKAREAAATVDAVVAVPPFDRTTGQDGTDWNDFAADCDAAAVAAAFNTAVSVVMDEAIAGSASDTSLCATDMVQAEITRLASLDKVAYELERKLTAERLNMRATALDNAVKEAREARAVDAMSGMFMAMEPWPDRVNGAELLDEVTATIQHFIVCEKETRDAAALWIAFTWFIDEVQVAPIALITAPEKRCGKTQLLDLIGRLVRRPLTASNISPAAVFRVIEAHQPTLLIDEADAFMRDNEELRGVINSGHTRSSAYVIRTVGDDHEPRQFSTWGAKAISGIGKLPETIMDRAIELRLRRKLDSEKVERLRHAEPDVWVRLARKLARFANDGSHAVRTARPVLPDSLNDRAQDNWEPLLAIADLAGDHWPQTARTTALAISGSEDQTLSSGTELLADIRNVFDQEGRDRLPIKALIHGLIDDDTAPWATLDRGKPMTPRQLSRRLSEYGIKARTQRVAGGTAKSYERGQFADAWARYLDASNQPISVVNE